MKVAVLVSLLLCAALFCLNVSAQHIPDLCLSVSCVEEGDECDSDFQDCVDESGAFGHVCSKVCPATLVCTRAVADRLGSTCVRSYFGLPCTETADCAATAVDPPLRCSDGNFTCIQDLTGYSGYVNDVCNENSDCQSGLVCDKSVDLCKGAALNQFCDSNTQCSLGLFCNGTSSFCASVDVSANCSIFDLQCGQYNFCNLSNGQCVGLYSQAEGAFCVANNYCGAGLFCNITGLGVGVCATFNTTNDGQTCEDKDFTRNSSACLVPGSNCVCDTSSGQYTCLAAAAYPVNFCAAEALNYYSCLQTKNCDKNSQPTVPGACAHQCFSDFFSYVNCATHNLTLAHAQDSCFVAFSYDAPEIDSGSVLLSWINTLYFLTF